MLAGIAHLPHKPILTQVDHCHAYASPHITFFRIPKQMSALEPSLSPLRGVFVCQADIERKCKNTKPKEGRVQRCLRRHKGGLGWGCREQLFRLSMENADDVRLNTLLFHTCLNDKKKVGTVTPACLSGACGL